MKSFLPRLGLALFAVVVLTVPSWGQPPQPAAPLTLPTDNKLKKSTDDLEDSYFLGPPLPLAGGLYVLNEKHKQLRLICLDPVRGKGQWVLPVGNVAVGLADDPDRRLRAAPLAFGEGVLVVPTGAGAILGVDLLNRRILWA